MWVILVDFLGKGKIVNVSEFREALLSAINNGDVVADDEEKILMDRESCKSEIDDTYAKLLVYRLIRARGENWQLSDNDFLSQVESNKPARGTDGSYAVGEYGCSFFENKEACLNAMRIPPRQKKIFEGIIDASYGVVDKNASRNTHRNCWRYKKDIHVVFSEAK